jgi:uncharacterized protein YaaW (UPF0174 family)
LYCRGRKIRAVRKKYQKQKMKNHTIIRAESIKFGSFSVQSYAKFHESLNRKLPILEKVVLQESFQTFNDDKIKKLLN